jgi:formylglycine-generating enzyme required for sulfatase activity
MIQKGRKMFRYTIKSSRLALIITFGLVTFLYKPSIITAQDATTTPIPTIQVTLDSVIVLASQGVSSNAEWTPYIQEFDGVPMVLVPVGCLMMGSTDEQIDYAVSLNGQRAWFMNEQPVAEICFDTPFWIDRYEVSNAQFDQFGGLATESSYTTDANLPREQITWFEAHDYCELRGARLPTEAEWEYAARGSDNLIFPWGNEFDGSRVNYGDRGEIDGYDTSAPVNAFTNGISWVAAYQLSGNVWEWNNTSYDTFEGIEFPYPYTTDDGREDDKRLDVQRVLRGGSWDTTNFGDVRSANRGGNTPKYKSYMVGFRCVRSV